MSSKTKRILVTGAGGFIGGHMLADLLKQGYTDIRAVDIKPTSHWYQTFEGVDNHVGDLKLLDVCNEVMEGVDRVFNFAADMGGMGFIETHKAECMLSVLINTHLLQAAKDAGVSRFLFTSSACVYAHDKQTEADVTALVETDAYPAMPEDGYGWEKLFSERMCRHFTEDYGLDTRIVRFHNVYGPLGTYAGGREKAPAATCRKVIEAIIEGNDSIEIWGDGEQTRSFMYIDDCIKGVNLIMDSDFGEPINLGSDELVTINQLVSIAEDISAITQPFKRNYKLDAPKGVRGRNSDNTLIMDVLGWAPEISLRDGLEKTYNWIKEEIESGNLASRYG
ncbi:MAG: NAD-dependent epimerase/dehydratase family protein [Pseudomonadota bacterium]